MKPLRNKLSYIDDTLVDIADDTNVNGAFGSTPRTLARDIAKAISSFKFVVFLVVWRDVLSEINIATVNNFRQTKQQK